MHQPSETTSLMVGDSKVDDKNGNLNIVHISQQRMLGATNKSDKSPSNSEYKDKIKVMIASVDGNQTGAEMVSTAKGDGTGGVVNNDNGSWFKAAQLITEILLMLFVSGLLLIAAVVIFSKKSPEFMESYEILPKTLFILCIVVAILSFLHWLYTKTMRLIKRHCLRQNSSAIYNLVTTQPEIVLLPRLTMTTTTTTGLESGKSSSSYQAIGVYIEQEKEPLNLVGVNIINEE